MRFHHLLAFIVVALIGIGSVCHCRGGNADLGSSYPVAMEEDKAWGSDAGPSKEGKTRATSVKIDRIGDITTGGLGCPVIVAGNQVFSTKTFAQISSFDLRSYNETWKTALSADGSYFAIDGKSNNALVWVFHVPSGKKICEIPKEPKESLRALLITRNKYVVATSSRNDAIRVWRADTGELVKEYSLDKSARITEETIDFTSDGKYMAVNIDGQLTVLNSATSKTVVVMQSLSQSVPREVARTDPGLYSDFTLSWPDGLKFSPDGKELVAMSSQEGDRIFCWNHKGKLTVRKKIRLTCGRRRKNDLQWFPDKKAWLIRGNIVDREDGRVLLICKPGFLHGKVPLLYDQDTIIGSFFTSPKTLGMRKVPWTQIKQSREAMAKKVPAYLSPYAAVDVKLDLGKLQGDKATAEKMITDAFLGRLQKDGIPARKGAPNFFSMRFSESRGKKMPVYEEKSSGPGLRKVDRGQTVNEVKGSFVVEFYAEGNPKPLWKKELGARSFPTVLLERADDRTMRESMLVHLVANIGSLQFPYFIPKDKNLVALPIILE